MKTLLASIYACIILFLILLFGCAGREPPPTLHISEDFSAAEAETIRSAFDAWCEAVGYCPDEAPGVYGSIVTAYGLRKRPDMCEGCYVDADNTGVLIRILADAPARKDLGALWVRIAHEIGHYCNTEHTETGLMAPVRPLRGEPMIIDAAAIALWKEGCSGY